ncbi:MAG: hypothetical protein M3Y59_11755 [Myxococcota bacterium]|nr:hypothetical protein [Myxococcota bacterium]
MNSRIRGIAATAALLLVGCLSPSESVSTRVGPLGGTLESALGARVVIPAGALTTETVLTLTVVEAGPDRLEVFLSPTDTRFEREVAMEVRYSGARAPALFRFESSTWRPVPAQRVQPEHRLLAGRTLLAGEFVAAPPNQMEDGGACFDQANPQDAGSPWQPDADGGSPGGEDGGANPDDSDGGTPSDGDGGTSGGSDGDGGTSGGGDGDGGTSGGGDGDGGTSGDNDGTPGDGDGGANPGDSDGGTPDVDGGGYNWDQGDGGWSSDPWSPDAGWSSELPWEGCFPSVLDAGIRAGAGAE